MGLFFDQEKEPQKTPYEEHIQTFTQRQGHGRRGRVHRRFPAARRSGPGGARQVQEGRVALLAPRAQMSETRRRGRRKALAAPGLRLLSSRARGSGSACGMPCAWRGGVAGSVGGAGQPVRARLRDGMHVADDGRQQEDRERFPACRVEDRGRHRRTGRRPAGIRHAMHVRRAHGDRRGRDQPQEGPHVHHRRRRPRTQAGDPGARRIRQTGPRPVLRRIDAGAARLHQDRHRRRRQVDRLVRRRIPPERGARARLIPHRLLDDRPPGPGQETVVEPGQASEGQDSRGGDEGPEIRRARKPRRPDRAPIHGPRHARRRGSQGPALPLPAAQGTPAHAPAPARRPSRGGNSNDGSTGPATRASPRSSNHAGRSAGAGTTSSEPSDSATPTRAWRRSTTGSRSPYAWPTASTTSTTSSP